MNKDREAISMSHPAETWHDAEADAEAVARVLATLDPTEWTVYRDVRWPTREFASLDHVVVGRKGVFVIDSLSWSGRVNVAQDQIRLNGCVRDSELGGAVEAAAAVADLLGSTDEREVQPVLCFVRDGDRASYRPGLGGRRRDAGDRRPDLRHVLRILRSSCHDRRISRGDRRRS